MKKPRPTAENQNPNRLLLTQKPVLPKIAAFGDGLPERGSPVPPFPSPMDLMDPACRHPTPSPSLPSIESIPSIQPIKTDPARRNPMLKHCTNPRPPARFVLRRLRTRIQNASMAMAAVPARPEVRSVCVSYTQRPLPRRRRARLRLQRRHGKLITWVGKGRSGRAGSLSSVRSPACPARPA